MPQYKYLYNNGVPQVTFNKTYNVSASNEAISWRNSGPDKVENHYYYVSVDLTGVSEVAYSCSNIWSIASAYCNTFLYVEGYELVLLKDTEREETLLRSASITVNTKEFRKVGFHFVGNSWNNGYAQGSISYPTLYLVYPGYTVKLNLGTGISTVYPETSNTVKDDESIDIDADVKSGYTWSKWTGDTECLTSEATEKENTVKPTKNVSLTAEATANTYTLTFNANGGTTSIISKSVTYNNAYGTLPTPTRIGYTFNGWYTAASGGTRKTSFSTYSTIGNSTLYAQWSPITYSITFNANGGSGIMNNMSCSYDIEYILTANSFTRTDYIFMGWATSANGEVVYKDKASIKNLSNTATTITLYAVWQQRGTVRIMVNNEYKTAQAYIFKDGFWLLT